MIIDRFNISNDQLDQGVYRIVSFDRFAETLVRGTNALVRPFLWNDPFENLLTYPSNNHRTRIHENEKFLNYAQCWSFSNENDLLWRAYSSTSDGVKIKSTPRKLIESFNFSNVIKTIEKKPKLIMIINEEELKENVYGFIGKVRYLTFDEIVHVLKENAGSKNLESYIETLLIKREAFKNEEEFRIGIRHFFGIEDILLELSSNIFEYDIDINNVFDEVVFDPRISDFKYNGLRHQILNMGFENPVLKSQLYNKPILDDILK